MLFLASCNQIQANIYILDCDLCLNILISIYLYMWAIYAQYKNFLNSYGYHTYIFVMYLAVSMHFVFIIFVCFKVLSYIIGDSIANGTVSTDP